MIYFRVASLAAAAACSAACARRYSAYDFASTAWLVMCISIASLTWGTYFPKPKSERFSVAVASKPTVDKPVLGLVPILTIVTTSVTGFVTPWRVSCPVTSS